jgi:rubrerythrin
LRVYGNLPSGIPLEETLKYGTIVEAALRDSTSWACPKCGTRNIAENETCAICKTKRPEIKVKKKKTKKKKKS